MNRERKEIWRRRDRHGLPRYCKLNIAFDAARLLEEYLRLWQPFNFIRVSSTRRIGEPFVLEPPEGFLVGSVEENERAAYIELCNGGIARYVERDMPAPRILVVDCHDDGYRSHLGDELPPVPHLEDVMRLVPLRRIDRIKVYDTPANGMMRSHIDLPDQNPERMALNLTLATGGSPMLAKIDEHVVAISDPAYFFYCDAPHGVARVETQRVTVRLFGEIDVERFWTLAERAAMVI